MESQSPNPILVDEKAVEVRQKLKPLLAQAEEELYGIWLKVTCRHCWCARWRCGRGTLTRKPAIF